MEFDNFVEYVRQMKDEDLAYIYGKQSEYAEEYIAAVEEELIIRGYAPEKLNSWETGQQCILKQKTDLELLELLNNRKSLYAPDFVRKEIENRQLTEDMLRDRYILQGKQGDTVLLIVLAVAGALIFPVSGLIFRGLPTALGSVLAWIAFILSACYSFAYKRLSSGKTVKKYNAKTRRVAGIILAIMLIIIIINIIILLGLLFSL